MWGLFNLNFWSRGGAGLERFYTLGIRPQMATAINIMTADGTCHRGLQIGDAIKISADGSLSNPMCRAAIEALKPVIFSDADSPDSRSMAGRDCPLSDARLTFAIGGSGGLIIT
jgi:hypothetical protein